MRKYFICWCSWDSKNMNTRGHQAVLMEFSVISWEKQSRKEEECQETIMSRTREKYACLNFCPYPHRSLTHSTLLYFANSVQ